MQSSHSPLSVWLWGAYLMTTQTPGQSALQFQRQLGLRRYETVFGILHKLRAGMVRSERDTIGSKYSVEVDECFVGGETRGLMGGPSIVVPPLLSNHPPWRGRHNAIGFEGWAPIDHCGARIGSILLGAGTRATGRCRADPASKGIIGAQVAQRHPRMLGQAVACTKCQIAWGINVQGKRF